MLVFYFVGVKSGMKLEIARSSVAFVKACASLIPLYLVYIAFKNFKWDMGFSFHNFYLLSLAGTISIVILVVCYYLLGINKFFKFVNREIV